MQPRGARRMVKPDDSPEEIASKMVLYLARWRGTAPMEVRKLYQRMHVKADPFYAALRLLVRDKQVTVFSGPPLRVMLRNFTDSGISESGFILDTATQDKRS